MKLLWQKIAHFSRFTDTHYAFFVFLVGIILYTLTLRGVYGNPPGGSIKNNLDQATKPFELSPERDRYVLILSLAENKSFALSKVLANAAYPDDGYYQGRIYIFFAPGISLLALPFYLLGKMFHLAQVASYFAIALFASATLVFLFKIARNICKMPVGSALAAPLIFAFGSSSWSYAITLYQHHVTTFFIIASFYAVWKFKQNKKCSWLWGVFVWTNYALAILVDYPNAILMLPVMIYFFFTSLQLIQNYKAITFSLRKGFILTIIPFIMITCLHGYYNQVNFGSWKSLSSSLTDYKDIVEHNLLTKKNGQQQIKAIQDSKQPVSFFKEENVTNGLYILLFSDERGIFYYSPIFILALLGIFSALKHPTMEMSILVASIAVNIFLYSSFGDPWGGWAFGARYLIPAMAILSLFVALWLSKYGNVLYIKLTAFILFIYSAAVALLGALTTNALPPKVEAAPLKIPDTYTWNMRFLQNGASSSFMYNTFFSSHISLIDFYIILYEIILALAVIIFFVMPAVKNYEHNSTN
jgi:hypothetical protein